MHGSCGLIHTLQEAGLVDEYRVIIFPVTVGAGKRLFSDAAPPSGYTMSNARTTAAGALYAEFVPTPFSAGTFEVEDGREVEAVRRKNCTLPTETIHKVQRVRRTATSSTARRRILLISPGLCRPG